MAHLRSDKSADKDREQILAEGQANYLRVSFVNLGGHASLLQDSRSHLSDELGEHAREGEEYEKNGG